MAFNFRLSTSEIAKLLNGKLEGTPDLFITNLNRIEFAGEGDITFLSDKHFEKYLLEAKPSCVIISEDTMLKHKDGQAFILVSDPYRSFIYLINFIVGQQPLPPPEIHPTVIIDNSTILSDNVSIGAGTIIGRNCRIGRNVIIYPKVVIYDDVSIGDETIIHSNTVICNDTIIGRRCLILPGAIIGSDGFGFLEEQDSSYIRIPQIGNVVIEDDVEIGANTTIDRSMIGTTLIEKGVKLDNLIHIAHSCIIGENTAMAAQTGVSGSTKIGKRNRFGGQVGVAGHIETGDDVILLAQSGTGKSLIKKGLYFGSPAKEHRRAFKIEASLRQLPELIEDYYRLKKLLIEKTGIKEA